MDVEKLVRFDGTYRICPPQDTLHAIQPALAKAGITRLADVTMLDSVGFPTWQAIRPRAVTLSVSQGKGLTHEEAQVSAAMESLERAAWEQYQPPLVWNSRKLLGPENSADPTAFADVVLGGGSPDAILPWCEARSLFSGRTVLVLADLVCVRRCGTHRKVPRWAYASSNGLAAGNSFVEASLHALFELIERDAQMCAESVLEQDATPRPRLDIRRCCSQLLPELAARIDSCGLSVEVFSNENPYGVPCYSAYLIDEQGPFPTNVGCGAHLDPNVAVSRAITEAAQGRITMISASREDNFRVDYPFLDEVGGVLLERAIYERSLTPTPTRMPDVPPIPRTVQDALDAVVERLRQAGADDILSIDMTDPETRIPAVKLLGPGLCGYHRAPEGRIEAHRAWLGERGQS